MASTALQPGRGQLESGDVGDGEASAPVGLECLGGGEPGHPP
jgi:hypothetical protein